MPTVSFDQLGVWVVCALVALDIYLRVAAHQREKSAANDGTKTVISPQPLEVKEHKEYATTGELSALKEDVGQLRGEVREGFSKLNDERRVSVANLHTKVDSANKKVDELGGQLMEISRQVGLVLNNLLNSK